MIPKHAQHWPSRTFASAMNSYTIDFNAFSELHSDGTNVDEFRSGDELPAWGEFEDEPENSTYDLVFMRLVVDQQAKQQRIMPHLQVL